MRLFRRKLSSLPIQLWPLDQYPGRPKKKKKNATATNSSCQLSYEQLMFYAQLI